MTFPPKVWSGVLRRLAEAVPDYALETWLLPLAPIHEHGRLRLRCPNSFHRERVSRLYRAEIAAAVQAEVGEIVELVFEVGSAPTPTPTDRAPSEAEAATESPKISASGEQDEEGKRSGEAAGRSVEAPRSRHGQTAMRASAPTSAKAAEVRARKEGRHGLTGSPRERRDFKRFSFDNFFAGSSNSLAREAALALARGQHEHLRQLFIAGAPGQGKTHLARAVVREALQHTEGRVLYTPAESFLNAFTASVRGRTTDRFKAQFRVGCSLLVVEDLHFLIGKRATQIELVHTLEAVLDAGGRVLLTGHGAPAQLDGLEPELRAQLSRSFVAELTPCDSALRREILRGKAASGGVHLPEDCLEQLAEAPTRNVRELESALEQLVTTSALEGRKIDSELTHQVLQRKGAAPAPRDDSVDPREVVQIVAMLCGTTAERLASRSRRRDVMEPRQIAMVLCHRLTDAPIAEIGRAFGRGHTSVRNAISKLEREMLLDPPLRYRVEAIRDRAEMRLRDANTRPLDHRSPPEGPIRTPITVKPSATKSRLDSAG